MKNIKINTISGHLSIDETIISPLEVSRLEATLNELEEKYKKITPTNGWTNFALDAAIVPYKFGLNISYHKNKIHSCWLAWDGGISKGKGYECTENELISDKNRLTKFMAKFLGKAPDEKNYTRDLFQFEWGYISTSASLQSAIATIGFSWKSPSQPT
jgi:hypothetical protein